MPNFNRLTRPQIDMLNKLLDYYTLWGDDMYENSDWIVLKQLVKRGIVSYEENDDNGGSIDWTKQSVEMFRDNDPLVPEWLLEKFNES